MTDHIKQMAEQAGFATRELPLVGRSYLASITEDALIKFAKLIAEDCAMLADGSDFGTVPHGIGDQIRARYNIT